MALAGPADYSKEQHFFDQADRFVRGAGFYGRYFPRCDSPNVPMDATPNYLASEGANGSADPWLRALSFYTLLGLGHGGERHDHRGTTPTAAVGLGLGRFKFVFLVMLRDPVDRYGNFDIIHVFRSISEAVATVLPAPSPNARRVPCTASGNCFTLYHGQHSASSWPSTAFSAKCGVPT